MKSLKLGYSYTNIMYWHLGSHYLIVELFTHFISSNNMLKGFFTYMLHDSSVLKLLLYYELVSRELLLNPAKLLLSHRLIGGGLMTRIGGAGISFSLRLYISIILSSI